MAKNTKRNIIIFTILIIIILLFLKGCNNSSIGGSFYGGSGGGSVEPLNCGCPTNYSYVASSRSCERNPCPIGQVSYISDNYIFCDNPVNTQVSCNDILNPQSQSDCNIGVCSRGNCVFIPTISSITYVPAHCACQ